MAFSEFEEARYVKICEDWGREQFPPEKCLGQLLPTTRIEDQTLFLGERRPHWSRKGEWIDRDYAKISWVKSEGHWKLYWMRGSTMTWTRYEPYPSANRLEDILQEIRKDAHACFFG